MDMQLRPPPPSLRGKVEALWALRGNPTARYSGLPKPYVEMIVSLSGEHFWQSDPNAPALRFEPGWVTPVQSGPRYAVTGGGLHLIGARLSIEAAHALFGPLPGGDVSPPIPLEALLGGEASILRERLFHAESDNRRLAILAGWLWERLREGPISAMPAPENLAQIGWRSDRFADLLGLSSRGLRKRFGERYGIGPKFWLQLNRFDTLLRTDFVPGSLAETAASFGYTDQAHMTAEFSRFAGHPPGRYARTRSTAQIPVAAPHFLPGQ